MGWQDVVAIGAVLGAVWYLGSLVYKGISGERKGCAHSRSCGHDAAAKPPALATIGPAKATRAD